MARIHGCSITQLSQTLSEFSLGLKRRAWLKFSATVSVKPVVRCSQSAALLKWLPENTHQGYVRQSHWATPLISIKVLQKSLRHWSCPRFKHRKNNDVSFSFFFFTLLHLNQTAWQITCWIIKPQPIKKTRSINPLISSPIEGNRWTHLHILVSRLD